MIDLEGSGSIERAECGKGGVYEKKMACFAMAVSDIVIVNVMA